MTKIFKKGEIIRNKTDNKKSFILYNDQWHSIKQLSNEEAGIWIKTIFKYVNNEKIDETFEKINSNADKRILQMLFSITRETLKRDSIKYKETCKRNSINALKKHHPELKQDELEVLYDRIHSHTNVADSDIENESESDIDIEIDSDIENESNIDIKSEKDIEYTKFSIKEKHDYTQEEINHFQHIEQLYPEKIKNENDYWSSFEWYLLMTRGYIHNQKVIKLTPIEFEIYYKEAIENYKEKFPEQLIDFFRNVFWLNILKLKGGY